MANLKPENLVLRCYGHRTKDGRYYGVCLELNLAAESESMEKLKDKLNDIIVSYIETVLDTNDKDSIPQLLLRKAPAADWIKYHLIRLLLLMRKLPQLFIFKEIVPFRLAVD